MKNILILGVCGFIGKFLCKRLLPEFNVIGYDRKDVPDDIQGNNFKYVKNDFYNDYFYSLLTEHKIDTVYHLISSTVPADGIDLAESEILRDVLPTVRLLKAMAQTGTNTFIFASSGGTVYGESRGRAHRVNDRLEPICSHGLQKCVIENYISLYNRHYNLTCISARIANPYGFWVDENRTQGVIPIFIRNLLSNKQIILYGDTVRDYIHIDDVTKALYKMLSYSGDERTFNIGTGQSHLLSEIVSIIENKCKMSFSNVIKKDIRACDVKESILDVSETIKELDWIPEYNIDSGISEIIGYYLQKVK